MTEVDAPSGWERRRRVLLGQYERVALELFARRGYRNVTVDDIAAEAGISIRTAFRYFPTKEECLLGYPRRGLDEEVGAIEGLEPDPDPLSAAWSVIREFFLASPVETDVLELWLAAATEAPEVVDRVRGARAQALTDALIAYCERSLGVSASVDPRPRVVAGVLVGVESALIESATRSPEVFDDVVQMSDATVGAMRRAMRTFETKVAAGRR